MTLLALLKHPLLRLDLDGRAVAALEHAVLRGPRPGPGSNGLAHALATFRAELEKFRRKERSDLHRSDPRTTLGDSELAAAAELVAKLGTALAPLEGVAGQSHRLSEIAVRHRDVVAALSRQDGKEAALAGADGARLGEALDEIAMSKAASGLLVDTSDYAELFVAVLAGRQVRPLPRSCVSSARSKRVSPTATAWCSAVWSKEPGRRKAVRELGSAGRCASSSASISRNAASA